MNLILDTWLPVLRASGERIRIAPHQLTELHAENPVVALDFPRPDFNGAAIQFLIGLLQTAFPAPSGRERWAKLYMEPPSPDVIQQTLEPLADAFALTGDGPCCFQDIDPLGDAKPQSVDYLLMTASGMETAKKNRDLFVKRSGVRATCEPCTAMALITLQMNAPEGGQGLNTSLRGGGPLTTLVVSSPYADLSATLWRDVWLNVLKDDTLYAQRPETMGASKAEIFPWLAPTRTSEDVNRDARRSAKAGGESAPDKVRQKITFADGHPLWVYWATPRRIRLDGEATVEGSCDVCGEHADRLIRQYRSRPWGANYTSGWRHPLSPYYKSNPTDPDFMPQHPRGALNYRYWLTLNGAGNETRLPALSVAGFQERRLALADRLDVTDRMPFRLRAFGMETASQTAVCWQEGTMPLSTVQSPDFELVVEALLESAKLAAAYLRTAIREAWFSARAKVNIDKLGVLEDALWHGTEAAFYERLRDLSKAFLEGRPDDAAVNQQRSAWHRTLAHTASALFEQHAENGEVALANPRRIAEAHKSLLDKLHGPKLREKTLGLPKRTPQQTAQQSLTL